MNFNHADLALGTTVSLDSRDVMKDDSIALPPYSLFGIIPLKMSIWIYFCLSFVFVEATYLSSLALRYTSFFSASMLDNVSIFAAIIASRLILKRRYSWKHILSSYLLSWCRSEHVIRNREKPSRL